MGNYVLQSWIKEHFLRSKGLLQDLKTIDSRVVLPGRSRMPL